MFLRPLISLSLLVAAPALAQPSLQDQSAAAAASAPQGTRLGVLVVDDTGREVLAINPDGRFVPASNTKLFTTAAAYAVLPGMVQPDAAGGARVALSAGEGGDVWLIGGGDARLSSAPDCAADCLSVLADAVAAHTRRVGDVIGDDSIWPDQRWPAGMSWNNIGHDSGTAVSALTLDDNHMVIAARPSAVGAPPVVTASPYYRLRNEAVTIPAGGRMTLVAEHEVNGLELRLRGEIPADAKGWRDVIGIDDPAHFAAWTLKTMLEARGVVVTGSVRAVHAAPGPDDGPRASARAMPRAASIGAALPPLARLVPPPLAGDVVTINKRSQNLHAQLLFRRLGAAAGSGSEARSAEAVGDVIAALGVPRSSYDLSDGAGMSSYNRVSPRTVVSLLRWGAAQPWGKDWRASFPVGGVDGTLARRFAGSPLQGRVWAKTGTVNGTSALSGYLLAASGRELTFSILANDVPDGASALGAIDALLLRIAAAN